MKREHAAATNRRLNRWTGVAVFALALAVRLLFWQATPDRLWPHSALYKGDAVTWTEYAAALRAGEPFELGLPLRPPGNGYLLAALGVDGPSDPAGAKLFWCLLGALAVALFHRAARVSFGDGVGLAVALWCALSTGLLALSTSLNNETPYLVLVAALLLLAPRLAAEPRTGRLMAWGGLNALACLFRVEHLLFFAAATLWLLWRRARGAAPPRRPALAALGRPLAVVALAAVAVLAPWHLAAWRALHRFNTGPMVFEFAAEVAQRGVERATASLRWSPEALAELEKLPGFARRTSANFVAATVLVRGGREVREEDFRILEEAFGYRPAPLASYPFVALYGPLNFYLANREGAPAGFDRDGLDRPPTLEGGVARYPWTLLAGLPPEQLNFTYPPHVEVVNEGYRLGRRWIVENPGDFLALAGRRLDHLWRGAALGWTGYGLPWGLDGRRNAVDLAVPEGGAFDLWRLALLGLCLTGLWLGRGERALDPWLLFAAAKLAAAVAFFGYARHGATLIPVAALLAVLAVSRLAFAAHPAPAGLPRPAALSRRKLLAAAVAIGLLGLGCETYRWQRPPTLLLDDRAIAGRDPFPPGDHFDRKLEVRP